MDIQTAHHRVPEVYKGYLEMLHLDWRPMLRQMGRALQRTPWRQQGCLQSRCRYRWALRT
jgi:hypothetical protein